MFSQQASASARPPSTQIKFRGQDWVLPLPRHSKWGGEKKTLHHSDPLIGVSPQWLLELAGSS